MAESLPMTAAEDPALTIARECLAQLREAEGHKNSPANIRAGNADFVFENPSHEGYWLYQAASRGIALGSPPSNAVLAQAKELGR